MSKRNPNYSLEALLKAGRGVLVNYQGKTVWAIRAPLKRRKRTRNNPNNKEVSNE